MTRTRLLGVLTPPALTLCWDPLRAGTVAQLGLGEHRGGVVVVKGDPGPPLCGRAGRSLWRRALAASAQTRGGAWGSGERRFPPLLRLLPATTLGPVSLAHARPPLPA